MDLMVNPPTKGRESDECFELYNKERSYIENGMKERARMLTETFNGMTNFSCNEIEGAMYAFPRIRFSDRAIARAKEMAVAPDFMYCMDLLNTTGIMVVPGSGFGQEENTWHFRITNLITPTEEMAETLQRLKVFNEEFHSRF